MPQLLPPISAVIGVENSIAEAVHRAACRAGGEVVCNIGSIRIGADPEMPIAVISTRYNERVRDYRAPASD